MQTSDISIAMGYKNRTEQLTFTLKTMSYYNFKGEIVISDDFSSDNEKAANLIPSFPDLNIKVVYPDKDYLNPCYNYNNALLNCSNDNIIIQNPECSWVHNIGEDVCSHLKDGDYLVYDCFYLHMPNFHLFDGKDNLLSFPEEKKSFWYSHHETNRRCLHFCSALTKKDLIQKMRGGFDERFAQGYAKDDIEFRFRVQKELNVVYRDLEVAHLAHGKSNSLSEEEHKIAYDRNIELYNVVVRTYGTDRYEGVFPKYD